MRKLVTPKFDALETFDRCVQDVGDLNLRASYVGSRASIGHANDAFSGAAEIAAWSNLPRVPRGNRGVVVAGTLTKKNLTDLYSMNMVGTVGPSRDIYDEILTAAGGFCPFCGGLGHVGSLDHYLPKANFPAYSVHPSNLVPCCRDCNTGKNSSFGQFAHQQTLHPYLDHDRFFGERWITALAYPGKSILVEYSCSPPEGWLLNDRQRVQSHFEGYDLALRFSVQAGSEVAKVVSTRASSLQSLSPDSFRSFLLDSANIQSYVLNGWHRTMYGALAATDWFLQTDFQNPDWHLEFAHEL